MAAIEERVCRDDTDCSDKQYCYYVSERCVDYTQCSRYNRQENHEKRSQHPSQCGPCLSGYTTEKLGTGEMALLCRKINAQQNVLETDRLNNYMIIYTTVGISLFLCLIATFVGILLRKRMSKQQNNKSKPCDELCVMEPTAPPLENRPFITCKEKSSPISFNNNKNLKDKNNLVRAGCYVPPSWIRTNPNYENDSSNDSINAMEPLHSMTELSTDDQFNSWIPEQLTLEVTNDNSDGYEIEQVDNSLNTILVETNNPSSSNPTEEDNNNNNNNGSTSESSNTQNSREHVRISNILISQKISMNVNFLNGDC